jgi:hypothetical protein
MIRRSILRLMMRARMLLLIMSGAWVLAGADGRAQTRSAAPPPVAKKVVTDATCAAELGVGTKTKRRFCDVVITRTAAESVTMKIPAHAGGAVLQFDLHNRFDVSTRVLSPILFARHVATVAVVRPTGAVIERASVLGEFRVAADAFDRVEGGLVEVSPGAGGTTASGVKAVAPGQPLPIRVAIPAGLTSVGIVGIQLAATGKTGAKEVFETPGRPIAVVSNLRIEYTPLNK